jgi:tryptophanase
MTTRQERVRSLEEAKLNVSKLHAEGLQPDVIHPFKGNIDLQRVEALLQSQGERIPFEKPMTAGRQST